MLITLKNDRLKDRERKKEIEALLGTLADDQFSILVNLGKKITDWSNEQLEKNSSKEASDENMDETIGVKVMIGDEDDDEEEDNDLYEVNEDDEDDEGQDAEQNQIISGKVFESKFNFDIF